MARDWESSFTFWAQSPSKTEAERCERVIRAIGNAVAQSPQLQSRGVKVFTQGSFRNRVNVRLDSDVDVGVMFHDHFLSRYPAGKTNADFGNRDITDYSFSQFKNELEQALVTYFGRNSVKRGNKAFDIKASASQVDADVVPLMEFRNYNENGFWLGGVALLADNGSRIENYPERLLTTWPDVPLHYENGLSKNEATSRRYRGMVRILKKLRIELAEAQNPAAEVPGYLLECLAWNTPNSHFETDTWEERVEHVLSYIWAQTKSEALCKDWCEVDDVKYLFRASQPWTMEKAHAFANAAWNYVKS